MRTPSISTVVTVYNADRYIGEALESILSQTRPPEEVVVVDDGSTDGTPEELDRFRGDIRLIRQENRGHAAALNRGMGAARGDYLAKCDADDIWEPRKLERQAEAVQRHPEIDIAFAAARVFGDRDGYWRMPEGRRRQAGVLEPRRFARALFQANPVCPSSTLIRRALLERLGPFLEHRVVVEDYEYWMRALSAGAVFFYDPAVRVKHRRHGGNVSGYAPALQRSDLLVREWNAELPDSRTLVRRVRSRDLFHVARYLAEDGRPEESRAVMLEALRSWPTPRPLAWVMVLSFPERYQRAVAGRLLSIKRTLVSEAPR